MEIPLITVEAESIAEAWENSILALWERGVSMETEYDRSESLPSRDATMILVVRNPLAEPRIHLAFPGGLEDLEKYRQEVVDGVHDDWIDPAEGKWTYTYHDRLVRYRTGKDSLPPVDQLSYIIAKLAEAPHSRRAQAITWIPFSDPETNDPPCLQRIWCRVVRTDKGLRLIMNTHWRSRDASRAAFMNLFGLTALHADLAERLSAAMGTPVLPGRYLDISDSYHIYGDCIPNIQEQFLPMIQRRDFFSQDRLRSRTMRSDDPVAIEAFQHVKDLLAEEKRSGRRGTTAS